MLNISQVNENKNIQKENTESALQIKEEDVIKKEESINVKKESSPLDELTAAINKYVPTAKNNTSKKNNSDQKNILQSKNENEIVANENDAATNLKNLISKAKDETLIEKEERYMFSKNIPFSDDEEFVSKMFQSSERLGFLIRLLMIFDVRYLNHFVYDPKKNRLLINIEMFVFKIYCNISKETRKEFIELIKPKGEDVKFTNTFSLLPCVARINTDFGIFYGDKPFYLDKEKNSMLTRKFVKHVTNENEEPIFYQGLFLSLSLKNKVGELLKDNNMLIKFDPEMTMEVEKEDGISYLPYSFYKLRTLK